MAKVAGKKTKKKTAGRTRQKAGKKQVPKSKKSASQAKTSRPKKKSKSAFTVEKVTFTSQDETLGGTFYLPSATKKPAVIVMGHGFGALQSFSLPIFAERFVKAGYAVFTFDYQTFGDSGGEPRHIVDPWQHQADFRAALEYVRTSDAIDPLRIVLWGTSYAGGHVVALAAERQPVKAVISQLPHLDAIVTVFNLGFFKVIRAVLVGLRDLIGKALGLRPYYSKVVSRPNEFGAMSSPEAYDGYYAMIPHDSAWENKFAARAFIYTSFYSPIRHAKRIAAPTLLIGASQDTITPVSAHRKAGKIIPGCEYHELDCHHFAPYAGEYFEKNIALQLEFLQRQVPA